MKHTLVWKTVFRLTAKIRGDAMTDNIDEMKAELEAAGYYWFQDSQSGMTFFVSVCPPELSLSVELPDFDFPSREEWNKACEMERDILKNQLIEKAYAHLTEKRRMAELEAFVKRVADARYPSLIWDITTLEWVKEAKALLGKE